MQGRLRLLLIIAFIVVIGALIVVFVVLPSGDTPSTPSGATSVAAVTNTPSGPPPSPTAEPIQIVVAVQNLARGAVIGPTDVALYPWPQDIVPTNSFTGPEGLDEVIGQRARTDIGVEQPVLTSMVVPDLSQLASVGSDLAASIPQGLRAVAIGVNRFGLVGYAVQAGDSIDFVGVFDFVEVDEDFQTILPNTITYYTIGPEGQLTQQQGVEGRLGDDVFGVDNVFAVEGPNADPVRRLTTQLTIQDALVMYVGEVPADGQIYGESSTPTPSVLITPTAEPRGGAAPTAALAPTEPPRPDIMIVAVTPQDAVILTWLGAAEIPLVALLRPAAERAQPQTEQATLDYVMRRYNIVLPPNLPYSLQSLTSIRALASSVTPSGE